jgi:hypothetical protein
MASRSSRAGSRSSSTNLNMKLVYDCKHRRVVYADVGKEVADFLFYGSTSSPCR